MPRKRDIPRERRFVAGGVLLLLLAVGVIVTGRIINRRAGQMSDRIVTQISESHCMLLQAELDRTEKILAAAMQFAEHCPNASKREQGRMAAVLLDIDSKARSVWFAREGEAFVRSYSREGAEVRKPACDGSEERLGTSRPDAEHPFGKESIRSEFRTEAGITVWVLTGWTRDPEGRSCMCGIDYPLPELYAAMSRENPHSRSSAMLLAPDGRIVYHPDSLRLGQRIGAESGTPGDASATAAEPSENGADAARARNPREAARGLSEEEAFREVTATGRSVITRTFSEYLGMEERRIYYPMTLSGERWVAGIGIPSLVIEQEIDDFHLYTILTAAISVVLFAVLLVLAQRRWRREYDRRRRSEQESAQLQLQQVIEQIDPHFLFNSLNSLYALIRCNPEQAREFTLTLSRVYRRVLERRKQILASLAEEIDFTWQYHSLQQIRFGDSLTLTSTIDASLRKCRIPAMSLQTLVENAVKHNRISARTPLHIDIRTEGDTLVIENNCNPRENDSDESLGIGLERIRSVYRFYTDRNIEIARTDTHFRCRLPLLPAEE